MFLLLFDSHTFELYGWFDIFLAYVIQSIQIEMIQKTEIFIDNMCELEYDFAYKMPNEIKYGNMNGLNECTHRGGCIRQHTLYNSWNWIDWCV